MDKFASSKQAIAECDVCGFRYKLKELKTVFVKGRDTNIKACKECWDPDHPQLKLGEIKVSDAQGIRNPRPDFAGYPASRAIVTPVRAVVGTVFLGRVTV